MKILKIKGVTFLELIITMGIVSILVSISYPSYIYYIKSTHLESFKIQLLDMSNDFDKIKRKSFTYRAILDNDGKFNTDIAPLTYPANGVNVRFNISVVDVTDYSYKIVGLPVDSQGEDYGSVTLEQKDGSLIGLYDTNNDETWKERWF